ncbi:hypothetical protein AB0H71_18725 [Nocardia sp. NPDC050697]|uniref:hypothetical protein n=1 Tax=Nocardia sp. NPDC050697 TaxID=3155158 RepID=UPI0033EE4BB9
MRVTDVLDFFARCPACGYAAQATAVERERADGRTDATRRIGCALPCGWQDEAQTVYTIDGTPGVR